MFASLWNTSTPTVQTTASPSAMCSPLDTLNTHAPATFVSFEENEATRTWIAQPQLQLVYPVLQLDKPERQWELCESQSQGYEGGNVTVTDTPTPFSSFSPSFSFNDFVSHAFPNATFD